MAPNIKKDEFISLFQFILIDTRNIRRKVPNI